MFRSVLRRGAWAVLLVALAVGIGTYLAARHGGAGELHIHDVRHRVLAPGAELVRSNLYRGAATAGQLLVLHLDPRRINVEVVLNPDRLKLDELAAKAQLVTNAGYFTPKYRPTGLLVSGGKMLSPFVSSGGPAGSGVLVVEDATVKLLRREDIGARRFDKTSLAVQAGPRLIEPDRRPGIRSDDGQHANRTFIGGDARGWLVIGVVYRADGGLGGGPSLFELQRILLKRNHGVTPIIFALNLDGGPSTGLHLRGEPKLDFAESGVVNSALVVQEQW